MLKNMKIGLLASAAFASLSTIANADGLADLKSVIAALSPRAALSQTSVQLPKGYTVDPTADAAGTDIAVEEPFVEVKVSGYIKTGFIKLVGGNQDAGSIGRNLEGDVFGGELLCHGLRVARRQASTPSAMVQNALTLAQAHIE